MIAYVATGCARLAYLVAVVRILVASCQSSAEQIHNIEVAETKQFLETKDSPFTDNTGGASSFRPVSCHDSQCHGHGQCLDNACVCLPHWGGSYCSTFIVDDYAVTCPDPTCSGHGRCDIGMCMCDAGWSGANCSIGAVCSDWCNSPGGTCQNGFCVCNRGWGGSSCGERVCPHQCWGHGLCDHGVCVCGTGWEGDECEIRKRSTPAPSPWAKIAGSIFGPLIAPAPAPAPFPAPYPAAGWTLGSIFNFRPAQSEGEMVLGPPHSSVQASGAASGAQGLSSLNGVRPAQGEGDTVSGPPQSSVQPSGAANAQGLFPGRPVQGEADTVLGPPHASVKSVPASSADDPTQGVSLAQSVGESREKQTDDPNILLLEEKRSTRKPPFVFSKRMFEHALEAAEHKHKQAKPVIREINGEPAAATSALSGASDVQHVESSALSNVATSAMHEVRTAMQAAQKAVAAAGILERAAAQEKQNRQQPFALGTNVFAGTPAPTTSLPASLKVGASTIGTSGCIDDCSGHGSCTNQVCSCIGGWSGEACDLEPCTNGCNGRGACLQGSCVCNAAFYGISCEYSRCLNDCSGHGLCTEGKCMCDTNWIGDTCDQGMQMRTPPPFTIPVESKQVYLRDALSGFVGEPPKECPEKCNGNGKCSTDSGKCDCFPGYSGVACQDFCPNFCSGQGKCTLGRCLCLAGFIGVDCSIKACCSGHGDCTIPDTCICNPGWIGDQCQMAMQCPDPSCSGHGACQNGQCTCNAGYSGVTCASPPLECGACPPGAQCDRASGVCLCGGAPCNNQAGNAGKKGRGGAGGGGPGGGLGGLNGFGNFGGGSGSGGGNKDKDGDGLPDGEEPLPNAPGDGMPTTDVNLHPNCNAPIAGNWNATIEQCVCKDDYWGDNCQNKHCADWNTTTDSGPDCSGHGMCVNGNCFCATGWGKKEGTPPGPNICNDTVCPIDCGLHGMCQGNLCICQEGWQGPACREPRCLSDCSGHGTCTFVLTTSPAECQCDYGWTGADCSSIALYQTLQRCPADCSGRGLCMNGKCICSGGGSGADCSGVVCPPGRSGENCEQIACPRDCSGYGLCFNGECACDNDHTASDCSIPMKCFEACYEICLPALDSPRCESCKGQCLTALNGPSIGKHNPMLARLYSLADLGEPGLEQNATSMPRSITNKSVSQHQPSPVKATVAMPKVHQRLRKKHKEVSAVLQTSHHVPRKHHEVSSVRVGSFKLR